MSGPAVRPISSLSRATPSILEKVIPGDLLFYIVLLWRSELLKAIFGISSNIKLFPY